MPSSYKNDYIKRLCEQAALKPETIENFQGSRAQKKKLITWRNKAVKLIDQLNEDHITLFSLQLLCFTGVPNVDSKDPESLMATMPPRQPTEISGLRSLVWRVIL